MNKLNTAVAAGLLALATEGCVIERGATSTGGRYDQTDTGYDVDGNNGYNFDTDLLDTGEPQDVTPVNDSGVPIECQNNYSTEIQRVLHEFMDRTNNAELLEISDLSQPVLQFPNNYDATPYYIQPETTETGYLIRGGVDFDNNQVAVGVANYDNDAEIYSDRQFLELVYDGQTPVVARTYVDYGTVAAGNAYDRIVQIEQSNALGGNCEVALKDGSNATLDRLVLCENPCEALLEALGTRAISVINQD